MLRSEHQVGADGTKSLLHPTLHMGQRSGGALAPCLASPPGLLNCFFIKLTTSPLEPRRPQSGTYRQVPLLTGDHVVLPLPILSSLFAF